MSKDNEWISVNWIRILTGLSSPILLEHSVENIWVKVTFHNNEQWISEGWKLPEECNTVKITVASGKSVTLILSISILCWTWSFVTNFIYNSENMTKQQRTISTPPVRWTSLLLFFVYCVVFLSQNICALRAKSGHSNPWGENQRPKLYTDYLTKHSGKTV